MPFQITLISLETGERRKLFSAVQHTPGDTMPSFSPDGRTLAFCRESNSGNCEIYLVHLTQDLRASSDPIPLTSEDHDIQGLDFTADGREIIFSSDRLERFALWRIPAFGGGAPRSIIMTGEDAIQPRISRGTGRLVYVRQTAAGTIRRIPVSGSAKGIIRGEQFLTSSRTELLRGILPMDVESHLHRTVRARSRSGWQTRMDPTLRS